MDYTVCIKELGKKTYLGYGRNHDFEGSVEKELKLWDEFSKNGIIEKLRAVSKNDTVYGIFCYRYDETLNRFSYHIACEAEEGLESDEFETLYLYPSLYAVFKIDIEDNLTKKQAYEKLNEIYWDKWLPTSGYLSMIEPETNASLAETAAINLFIPYEYSANRFTMEIWYPISKIAVE